MNSKWYNWDWVRHNRDTLVVTIGESWTWGDGLGLSKYPKHDDRDFRLANVYGARLANKLNADFINIAEPGQSNLWIADQLDWAKQHINELNYKKIYWFATLTEVGREFNGDRDSDRVYTEILKNVENLDDFLNCLSELVAQKLSRYPDTVFATNFVDSNYPDYLKVAPDSWIDLTADALGLPREESCYVMQGWVFERFNAINEFCPNINRKLWLDGLLAHIERGNRRMDFLFKSPLNFNAASRHPRPESHNIWAEYLLTQIS